MRTIEIDIDVHKAIEAARTSFSQTDNDILRLLLEIDKLSIQRPAATEPNPVGLPWKGFNRKRQRLVEVAHATPLRADYSGQEVRGFIDNGAIVAGQKRYAKPSPALIENVTTKAGDRTQLNGWREWKAQIGGRWIRLTDL
jgi:hypothetical protein